MKTSIFILYFALSLPSLGFSEIDESRKFASYARGEGAELSELRRPGKAHLNWEGFKVNLWADEIKGSRVLERNYLSTYGYLDEKWYAADVIKEDVVNNRLSSNSYEAKSWSLLHIQDYAEDPTHFRVIRRAKEDPYWNEGMIRHWVSAEPGLNRLRTMDQQQEGLVWNEAVSEWEGHSHGPEERPIYGVQHTSQIRDWYFA